MIIDIEIKDRAVYAEYVDRVRAIVKGYGGRYLVRGGDVTPLSDNWRPERIVVIEFDTRAQLQNCFRSPEYLELAALRKRSTIGKAIVVDGYTPLHNEPER
jgi:uncharacterized protein (DUF1330 family)